MSCCSGVTVSESGTFSQKEASAAILVSGVVAEATLPPARTPLVCDPWSEVWAWTVGPGVSILPRLTLLSCDMWLPIGPCDHGQ